MVPRLLNPHVSKGELPILHQRPFFPRPPHASEEMHSVAQLRSLGVILHTSLCLTHPFQSSTRSYHFYLLKYLSDLSSPCLHCHEHSLVHC